MLSNYLDELIWKKQTGLDKLGVILNVIEYTVCIRLKKSENYVLNNIELFALVFIAYLKRGEWKSKWSYSLLVVLPEDVVEWHVVFDMSILSFRGWQSMFAYGCHNFVVVVDPETVQVWPFCQFYA